MVFLGSGSSGNATAVSDGVTTVLIDCGFSAREVANRLTQAHIAPSSVSAVLVTHEHSDHIRGIDVFCRRHATAATVCASAGTLSRLDTPALRERQVTLRAGDPVRIGTLEVLAFPLSHDAAEPLGFRITADGGSVGLVTDTGVITAEAHEALAGCIALGIESNHDIAMLENGPYPAFLKRRIRSRHGHLSNADAADALALLAHDRLRSVVALHRSRTNNTRSLAAGSMERRISEMGLQSTVTVAGQNDVCETEPHQPCLFDS